MFREEWDALDIAYDDFIRTTEPRHHEAVQEFLQLIYDAGDIELGTYEGLYCVSCEAYYSEDELVERQLPDPRPSGRARHRGELLLQAVALRTTGCSTHYAAHPDAVQPESRRNEVLGFIRGGLQDFSMSRTSITWGVPLPWDPKHVAYVWADALFNYCTAVGFADDKERFAKWWPADYHLIGKDILRFHAVYWPAMLMSAGLEPPKCVFAHGWLLVSGEKMSKTRHQPDRAGRPRRRLRRRRVPLPLRRRPAVRSRRRLLLRGMVARYNADLANNFGNLANRVLNMAVNYCDGVVPDTRENGPLVAAAAAAYDGMAAAMDRLDFASGFRAVWDLIRAANAFIEDASAVGTAKGGRRRRGRGGAR